MPNYVSNVIKMIGSEKDVNAVAELLRNKSADPNMKGEAIDFNNVVPMPETLNLVSGGHDQWYVAAYVNTLSNAEMGQLAKRLADVPTSFYGSYLKKYMDAFTRPEIPSSALERMQERFQEDYKVINPTTIEEVGKAYIDNILNYGADTWYDWSRNNWGTKWGAMNSTLEGDIVSFDTAWSAAIRITECLSKRFPKLVFAHEWADEDIGSNCGRYVLKAGEVLEEYLPEGDEAVAFACNMWGYDADEYLSCFSDVGEVTQPTFVSLDDVIASCKEISEAAKKPIEKAEPKLEKVEL